MFQLLVPDLALLLSLLILHPLPQAADAHLAPHKPRWGRWQAVRGSAGRHAPMNHAVTSKASTKRVTANLSLLMVPNSSYLSTGGCSASGRGWLIFTSDAFGSSANEISSPGLSGSTTSQPFDHTQPFSHSIRSVLMPVFTHPKPHRLQSLEVSERHALGANL